MNQEELFKYMCEHQGVWGRAYKEQQRRIKLQKNRAEKQRVKDKLEELKINKL
jgi:hypothetical protein